MATHNITSWTDLKKIGVDAEWKLSDNYLLMNDLTGSDADAPTSVNKFTSIGLQADMFLGVFDGQGYTISGLNEDNTTHPEAYSGVLFVFNEGVICRLVSDNTNMKDGICHLNYGHIYDCINLGNFTRYYDMGGIVSVNYGVISRCYNFGNLVERDGASRVGGICAYNDIKYVPAFHGVIEFCFSIGDVSSEGGSQGCGILCGENTGTARDCGWIQGATTKTAFYSGSGTATNIMEASVVSDFHSEDFGYESGVKNGVFRKSVGDLEWSADVWYFSGTDLPVLIKPTPEPQWPFHRIGGKGSDVVGKVGGKESGSVKKIGGI